MDDDYFAEITLFDNGKVIASMWVQLEYNFATDRLVNKENLTFEVEQNGTASRVRVQCGDHWSDSPLRTSFDVRVDDTITFPRHEFSLQSDPMLEKPKLKTLGDKFVKDYYAKKFEFTWDDAKNQVETYRKAVMVGTMSVQQARTAIGRLESEYRWDET